VVLGRVCGARLIEVCWYWTACEAAGGSHVAIVNGWKTEPQADGSTVSWVYVSNPDDDYGQQSITFDALKDGMGCGKWIESFTNIRLIEG
jgi:hypothetical protein